MNNEAKLSRALVRRPEAALVHAPAGNAQGRTEAASSSGLLDFIGLNWRAWATERTSEAEVRILQAEQRRLAARRAVAQAELDAERSFAEAHIEAHTSLQLLEWNARLRIARAALEVEETEAERVFRKNVQNAAPEEARRIVGASLETERLLLERDHLRRQRLNEIHALPANLPVPATPSLMPPLVPVAAEVETHITARQIEALALKAVTRFGNLTAVEAERAWQEWRQELERRLPPYAVQEVTSRADELQEMVR